VGCLFAAFADPQPVAELVPQSNGVRIRTVVVFVTDGGRGWAVAPMLKVVREPGGYVVECHPILEDNVLRGDVRSVAEALGYEVHAEHLDIGRVYLKPQSA